MSNTALLVMDIQKGIVGRIAAPDYLPRLAQAVEAARNAGIPVLHVVVGFRSGHPEAADGNKMFGALPEGAFTPEDPDAAIHPDIAPRLDEVVITKKRVSAFAGSDLEMVLRAGGFTHLVLAGVATSGVVLSTCRQAADLDYRLTVLADGCADADEEVHRVLTEKVFPRQAEVTSVEEWTKAVG
ncbi:cysteine hydrolase family protein [Streptomyces botrytidirepellens]|uniref:Cysteine hydrolase n=1 Tax=Streptomyces botrytidirepellens TaxID=2486417 RepID=A0A3M8SGX4_9ACTN|nr:isochorismatase family cysteine hydrolase [Streptomyces botrytidirepellens]RNF78192.1 cysteine hydrolase [Streptomyces botrytidirepellens]